MTKADIINEVAIATGMAKKEVSIVVESFMEEVKKSLIQNKENVYLRGSVASTSSTVQLKPLATSLRTPLSPSQLTICQASSHLRASSRRCRTLSKRINIFIITIFKILKSCQTERKRRVTRWLLTSVKRDYVRTDIRASKLF